MSQSKLAELDSALLDAAQAAEWSLFEEIQQERRKLLSELQASDFKNLSESEAEALRAELLRAKAVDQRCMQLAQASQEESRAQLQQVHKGKRMKQAYGGGSR